MNLEIVLILFLALSTAVTGLVAVQERREKSVLKKLFMRSFPTTVKEEAERDAQEARSAD